ncbi:carboxyltransferase domain-containing protein [Gordonia sp. TBRC 11910]|uniref:Carboxyltransferase domain-containing protein n=1 Tax=Gordonia asplenii TaxID=2725283 RepID=A0A848KTS5_9ACTN|nr:carboxyltransferase domain-containing protein [Gordonia asplenii]NMO01579.1 carboxyltransferase domain-containing protein [Gordonia asplenii]
MRERPAGPNAVLLDFTGHPAGLDAVTVAADAIARAVDDGSLAGISEVIPAASTLLVQADGPIDALGIRRALRGIELDDAEPAASSSIEIAVRYDGPDVDEVGELLGLSRQGVLDAHACTRWRVAFIGFAPGFGYLVPEHDTPLATLSRRAQSRPRVAAGTVAVAAGYSAVYPTDSPGGWYLLGHTDFDLWNLDREPPARLTPGTWVRFVSERR